MHPDRRKVPCLTFVEVFRSWNRRHCLKFWTRSIRSNFLRRSARRWICELRASTRYTRRPPRMMGYHPLNCCSAYLTSGRCSSVEGGRYAPTSGVWVDPVTILHLTMFGPWKRVDSTPHPSVRILVTRPTPPWDPPEIYGRAFKHVTF